MAANTENRPVGLRAALSKRQVVFTMAGVMMAMFLASLDQTIVGTAMPRIISDLGGFAHYTWVTTAYIITSAVVMPITGKLTDMYGRKIFYLAGLAIFTVGSLLSGLSQTMTEIIIFRGLQGIGAGTMMANAFTVIADLFPPAERGKFIGLLSAVFGVSAVIGPVLGGFITDAASWHWVFFINIPLGIAVILLFVFFFPNYRPDQLKHRLDYTGLTTLVLAVVPALLALSWGGDQFPWTSAPILGMFAFAAIMLFVFVRTEARAAEPILPPALFKSKIVIIATLVVFFTAFGMFGSIIFVPLFFQGVLGLSATASGSFLTPMMLGQVGGSFIAGQLLARAGGHYKLLGGIGLAIMAVGMALLARMDMSTGYAAAVLNIIVAGVGLGITMPVYTIAVQNAVPYNILGVASSSTAFFRSIGGSVGLAIFGSALTTRFATDFIRDIPAAVKAVIPSDQLVAMAHNPQALVSPEAQTQLQGMLAQLGPQGTAVYQQLLQVLRQALDSALSTVFLIALITVLIALVIHFFIKEIPLRKRHDDILPLD